MPPKKNQKKSQQASKANSKVASKVSTPQPPGTPLEAAPPKPLGTAIIGINFGQTASSIALINKDGTADCIANDDGERQIPSVISFSGSQTYVGNPARLQLIRNQANTVVGFRNLLGKSHSEVGITKPLYNSAAILNKDDEPAYLIKPEADGELAEAPKEQILTVTEITTKYLQTLLKYAEDFIGRKADGAVLSVPDWFTATQTDALRLIVEGQLGVKVLQFISQAGATAVASDLSKSRPSKPSPDSNLLVLDVGGSSSSASILARRNGLVVPLASCTDTELGGNHFEDQLMEYFVKEFNKKNKTSLDLSDAKNHKSAIKLRLATEVTKKTLSASNSANCSVDSLFDGYDFSGSINRMRCDLLLGKLYARIMKLITEAVAKSGLNKEEIDQAILTGGSTKLPAIREQLTYTLHPEVKVECPIEPDEVVAIGCALQADLIVKRYPLDSAKLTEFERSLGPNCVQADCLSQPLGLLLPAPDPAAPDAVDGKRFVTLLHALTPLPIKRVFHLQPSQPGKSTKLPIDLWQGEAVVKLEEPKPNTNGHSAAAADEEEEEEEEPARHLVIKPHSAVAHLELGNVKEGDRVTVTISIEKGNGIFSVSSGPKGVENHVQTNFAF